MADWSNLDRDYKRYDYNPYYQEKDQNAPAQCTERANCPSPTLTLLLSPPSTSCEPYKGENPRDIRNKAEKQRRDKMNQSVLRLASIVPTVAKPGRKLNKTSVLRLAAHYLRSHQHVFGNSIHRGTEFNFKFTETLLKNLKGFLITTTYRGIVVVVSPNVEEYLGYTELELLGQNIYSIVHSDDHQILREQLLPRACSLTTRGELSIPKEIDADKKLADALANERRNFVIRLKKLNQQRSERPQYILCHVEGSFRKADHAGSRCEHTSYMGRRARSRGENPFASGNDVVFVAMVRPTSETFVREGILEYFRMEYRTRHSIDGEIIQCEQRIALVTGYMTHEVNGVNAMNFMHRNDVRWVVIALREMYDQHRLVGESCYRLMTKNGQFIYMRTLGWLDVDQNSKAVTSFVCTNTVVAEQEGKQLIKRMKKKFTLMINNYGTTREEEDMPEDNEKLSPPVEDPKQLEKVILHLVTDLPSNRPGYGQGSVSLGNGELSSHLAIIPPKKEKIHEAIEKSYSVIRSCYFTMDGEKRNGNKNNIQSPEENASNNSRDLDELANEVERNMPSVSGNYSRYDASTTARMNANAVPPTNDEEASNFGENLDSSLHDPAPQTNNLTHQNNRYDWQYSTNAYESNYLQQLVRNDVHITPSNTNLSSIYTPSRCLPRPSTSALPKQQSAEPQPSTSRENNYENPVPSTSGIKRNNKLEKYKDRAKKMKVNNKQHELPKEIEDMITKQLNKNAFLEKMGQLPNHSLLTEGELEKIIESIEQPDGISSRDYNETFHYMIESGKYYEDNVDEENVEKENSEDETESNDPHDVYLFKDNLKEDE